MNPDFFLKLVDKERNIYEHSTLFDQARREVSEYVSELISPGKPDAKLELHESTLYCKSTVEKFPVQNNVADFIGALHSDNPNDAEWVRLNEQFMNYHKSLSVYTMVNSLPFQNYLALKSGIAALKDMKVVDVGGGTGHVHASFFHYPETIQYYLVDPNLRLLHDQFLRFYPKLSYLKMAHILAFAEELPFRSGFADMVMSLSAIDHFKDYKKFFAESARILKPGGIFFLSSHLDIPVAKSDNTTVQRKIFSEDFPERLARFLYYRRNKVGHDDHTYHFTDTKEFVDELEKLGFTLEKNEIYKRYFFIVARKRE